MGLCLHQSICLYSWRKRTNCRRMNNECVLRIATGPFKRRSRASVYPLRQKTLKSKVMSAFFEKSDRSKAVPSFRTQFEFTDRFFGLFGLARISTTIFFAQLIGCLPGLNYESFRDDKFLLNQVVPYVGLMVTPVFLAFAMTAIHLNLDKPDILINALIGAFVAANVS